LLQVSPPVATEESPAGDEPARTSPPSPEHRVASVPSLPAVAAEARVTDRAASVTRPAEPGAPGQTLDTTYYAARQLDVYPALISPLDLDAIAKSEPSGTSGRALLLVSIDAGGIVNEVNVVDAGGARWLDDARRAFTSARFTPAYRNGRAVRSRVLVRIDYGEERAAQD
jgi:protein TonB